MDTYILTQGLQLLGATVSSWFWVGHCFGCSLCSCLPFHIRVVIVATVLQLAIEFRFPASLVHHPVQMQPKSPLDLSIGDRSIEMRTLATEYSFSSLNCVTLGKKNPCVLCCPWKSTNDLRLVPTMEPDVWNTARLYDLLQWCSFAQLLELNALN